MYFLFFLSLASLDFGRVGRGILADEALPLVKPDMQISSVRLS